MLDFQNCDLQFTINFQILQVNAVFTWKTSKLGHTQQKQTQNGQPKKKFKVSRQIILSDRCQQKTTATKQTKNNNGNCNNIAFIYLNNMLCKDETVNTRKHRLSRLTFGTYFLFFLLFGSHACICGKAVITSRQTFFMGCGRTRQQFISRNKIACWQHILTGLCLEPLIDLFIYLFIYYSEECVVGGQLSR